MPCQATLSAVEVLKTSLARIMEVPDPNTGRLPSLEEVKKTSSIMLDEHRGAGTIILMCSIIHLIRSDMHSDQDMQVLALTMRIMLKYARLFFTEHPDYPEPSHSSVELAIGFPAEKCS